MDKTLDPSRVEAELRQFSNLEEIHVLPKIQSYWSHRFIASKFQTIGFSGQWDFYLRSVLAVRLRMPEDKPLKIVSIGSGNCDIELDLAKRLVSAGELNFEIECLDLNPAMLKRGAAAAEQNALSRFFKFTLTDLSDWSCEPDSVSVFFANQSLHHIVELEHLFDLVTRTMAPEGCLLTGDMIGRNGHMLWPEALAVVSALWASVDKSKHFNHRTKTFDRAFPNTDFSGESFEGIRAQDILPLLVKYFHQDVFLGFNSISRPFISRAYGHNYHPENEADAQFIRFLGNLDDNLIDEGVLKPTQCFATFCKVPPANPRQYKHWSAEFCIRNPN